MKVLILLILLGFAPVAIAETVVTTYVTKVQEQRRSTRWTLTEWLRIKERMKLMDVWLAMFSNPKKDKFRPELNLVYRQSAGAGVYSGGVSEDQAASVTGEQGGVQLYLTNLVSASTGIRTFNVDFGVEGVAKKTNPFKPDLTNSVTTTTTTGAAVPDSTAKRENLNSHYAALFRVFGKNIQDSSLALRVGQYQNQSSLFYDDLGNTVKSNRSGLLTGAELQLYFFRWFGVEGNYNKFHTSSSGNDQGKVAGSYLDYSAYIEVSLVRLMVGQYQEKWDLTQDNLDSSYQEKGVIGGVKVQF